MSQHVIQPTLYLVRSIDRINDVFGRGVAWIALLLVLVQFIVVVLRYVFAIGFLWMQEMVWYCHGLLFMLGAAYTLQQDGHVRVDIFYRGASERYKAAVDFFGAIILLLPLCVLTITLSWSYVLNAWAVFEGSLETWGLPALFLFKTVIWVFAGLLGLQGLSLALRSGLKLAGVDVDRTTLPASESGTGSEG